MVDFSNRYGDGYYDLTVTAEYRFHLIQQGIAANPNFSYIFPRYLTGYGESVVARAQPLCRRKGIPSSLPTSIVRLRQ
jgi:hypothetical protein